MANTEREKIVDVIYSKGELDIMGGQTETFEKEVDLKEFLEELSNKFKAFGFKDSWEPGVESGTGILKAGEFVDNKANLNRTSDMFETKYVYIKKGFANEIEIEWKLKRKVDNSDYGLVEYKLDLVNRFMNDKEVQIGESKKKIQGGTWEFRNSIVYKNSVKSKYLEKIPFIKNSEWLKKLVLTHIYYRQIDTDIGFCLKVKAKTNEVLHKHFG